MQPTAAHASCHTLARAHATASAISGPMRGSALRKSGVRYDNIYHFLFRVRDGKIAEIREHHDTLYASQVFSDGLGGGAPTSR